MHLVAQASVSKVLLMRFLLARQV